VLHRKHHLPTTDAGLPLAMNDSLRKRPSGMLMMKALQPENLRSWPERISCRPRSSQDQGRKHPSIQGRLTATGHPQHVARMASGKVGNGPAGSLKGQTRGRFPPNHHRISLPRRRHSKRCDRAGFDTIACGPRKGRLKPVFRQEMERCCVQAPVGSLKTSALEADETCSKLARTLSPMAAVSSSPSLICV